MAYQPTHTHQIPTVKTRKPHKSPTKTRTKIAIILATITTATITGTWASTKVGDIQRPNQHQLIQKCREDLNLVKGQGQNISWAGDEKTTNQPGSQIHQVTGSAQIAGVWTHYECQGLYSGGWKGVIADTAG